MVFDLRRFALLGVVAALHSSALLGAVQTAATSSLRPTTQDRSCAETTSRDQFTALFQRAEGHWQVSIRDFDEQGRSTYENRQVRVFQRAIGGRYFEERGLVERNGVSWSASGSCSTLSMMAGAQS